VKIKLHYLFSKNNKIGSRFIAWGTKHLTDIEDTPSHVAILVNGRWVHESTLFSGVRVISYKKWLEINTEVAKIPCIDLNRSYGELKEIYKSLKNKKYDWMGILYLGWFLFLNKYFGKDIPETNAWQSENRYFCCEAVEKVTGIDDTSMKAPVELLDELSKFK
jgi:hypothetical protein